MIYGYEYRTLNEHGLKQMREVGIASAPDNLRELAAILLQAADELEQAKSARWQRASGWRNCWWDWTQEMMTTE